MITHGYTTIWIPPADSGLKNIPTPDPSLREGSSYHSIAVGAAPVPSSGELSMFIIDPLYCLMKCSPLVGSGEARAAPERIRVKTEGRGLGVGMFF